MIGGARFSHHFSEARSETLLHGSSKELGPADFLISLVCITKLLVNDPRSILLTRMKYQALRTHLVVNHLQDLLHAAPMLLPRPERSLAFALSLEESLVPLLKLKGLIHTHALVLRQGVGDLRHNLQKAKPWQPNCEYS